MIVFAFALLGTAIGVVILGFYVSPWLGAAGCAAVVVGLSCSGELPEPGRVSPGSNPLVIRACRPASSRRDSRSHRGTGVSIPSSSGHVVRRPAHRLLTFGGSFNPLIIAGCRPAQRGPSLGRHLRLAAISVVGEPGSPFQSPHGWGGFCDLREKIDGCCRVLKFQSPLRWGGFCDVRSCWPPATRSSSFNPPIVGAASATRIVPIGILGTPKIRFNPLIVGAASAT